MLKTLGLCLCIWLAIRQYPQYQGIQPRPSVSTFYLSCIRFFYQDFAISISHMRKVLVFFGLYALLEFYGILIPIRPSRCSANRRLASLNKPNYKQKQSYVTTKSRSFYFYALVRLCSQKLYFNIIVKFLLFRTFAFMLLILKVLHFTLLLLHSWPLEFYFTLLLLCSWLSKFYLALLLLHLQNITIYFSNFIQPIWHLCLFSNFMQSYAALCSKWP